MIKIDFPKLKIHLTRVTGDLILEHCPLKVSQINLKIMYIQEIEK